MDKGKNGTPLSERLFLEALEERIAPAGNVVVVVSGGNLTITGDAENNSINVTETAPDQFHIVGNNGTTINGSADYYADGVTGGAKIAMGDGLDEVEIGEASLAKSVSVDLGPGDGRVSFGKDFYLDGALTISAKDGFHHVDIGGAITDKTTIKLGGNYGSGIGLYAEFGSDLKIQLGGGEDDIEANEIIVDGKFQLIGGSDSTNVSIVASNLYGDLFVQNSQDALTVSLDDTLVEGSLKIVDGKGATRVELSNDTTIYNAVDVKGGIGDDWFGVVNSNIAGGIKIQHGIGESIVQFSGAWVGTGFPGAHAHDVFVNNTKGASTFDVQGGNFDANKLTLNYGQGNVTVQVRDADILKDFSLKNSSGPAWLGLFDTDIAGKTSISTGADDDTLYLDGVHCSGALAIATGKGSDSIGIEQEFTPGNTSTFDGKVQITLGDGDDDIYIGQQGVGANAAIFNGSVAVDGGKGTDLVNYLNGGNTFAVPIVLKGFETTA